MRAVRGTKVVVMFKGGKKLKIMSSNQREMKTNFVMTACRGLKKVVVIVTQAFFISAVRNSKSVEINKWKSLKRVPL